MSTFQQDAERLAEERRAAADIEINRLKALPFEHTPQYQRALQQQVDAQNRAK